MDDVVSTFRLLRLPNKAFLNTLRIMNPVQIFGISLLSKKTKNLARSLKFTAESFKIHVSLRFYVELDFPNHGSLSLNLYEIRENGPPQELGTPEYIQCGNMRWMNSRSVKQMLNHLQFIFHRSITLLYFGFECECFNLDSIHRIVNRTEIIRIYTFNKEHSRRILSLFQTNTLDILEHALVDGCIPRDVLIQNLDLLFVHNAQITLDDLVMTNIRAIDVSCREMSLKIINQFLKVWVKGSNSRLEWVHLQFIDNSSFEELLKGLNYKDAPPIRLRLFKTAGVKEPRRVAGGWDIWRDDGTQATVTFTNGHFDHLHLFVWHDHCLVSEVDS